jgi:hypothetical protein
MAELNSVGLGGALHDVQEAGEGELAEDGGEDRAEALVADGRLVHGITRRGAPEILPKAELGRGDRRSVEHHPAAPRA